MAGAQQQHPVQGPSVNPLPQAQDSKTQPILTPVDSGNDLERYRTLVNVDSVYYGPTGSSCAVVLNVGFHVPLGIFKSASFSIRVPGVRLEQFPERDEVVHVPMNEGEGSLLYLLSQRQASDDEVRWQFINQRGDYFPSTVKLLLLVKGGGSPYFSFDLEILPTLELHIKEKRWHVWTTRLRPRISGGWTCQIKDDYYPETAKMLALEYEKPEKERESLHAMGLRGAVDSYSQEFK